MDKKTIIVLTCVWGRPEVTKLYIKGIKLSQSKLKDVYNFKNIVVDSDESNKELFIDDTNFIYFNHQNLPVSNKWNFALSQCRNLEFDYILMMGSDDIISDSVLLKYKDFMDLNYEYIGLTDLFVYNTIDNKFYYWAGYGVYSGRYGESLGLGRCIHKNIINNFNYKLWDDNLNKGLDGSMEKKMRSLPELKRINFNSSDHGVSCDIKSTTNITKLDSFINQLTEINLYDIKYHYVRNCVFNYQISIIIPTYDVVEYLQECLNSIINSIKDLECEILVGIDGCQKTLDYINQNSFDRRIRFFYFEKNVGPYIIKNTLAEISMSDYILFFDSDDVIKEELILDIINFKNKYELIKPMYLDFQKSVNNIDKDIKISNTYGEGVFAINKEFFLNLNGFEGWRCAADSDLMGRLYKNKIKLKFTTSIGFYRRVHVNSLTQKPETNMFSPIRRKYASLSKQKKYHGPLDELITEPYIELSVELLNIQNFESISELKNDIVNDKTNQPIQNINYNEVVNLTKPKKLIPLPSQNTPVNRNDLFEIKKGTLAELNRDLFPKRRRRF